MLNVNRYPGDMEQQTCLGGCAPPELKGSRWAGRELCWKTSSVLGWAGFQIPAKSPGAHTTASDP